MMKTSKKDEDFKIFVEDEEGNYIITSFVHESESTIIKIIDCKVKLKSMADYFIIKLTRQQIKDLSILLSEVATHL
jgi:hypothetical protein